MRAVVFSSLVGLLSLGVTQAEWIRAGGCGSSCLRRLQEAVEKQQARELELQLAQKEYEEFEGLMKQGLRGRDLQVSEGCGHNCDCFSCGEVVTDPETGVKTVTIEHCKSGSISWICCTGVDGGSGNCATNCGSAKCETQGPTQFKVYLDPGETTFTINTHDGQTAGDANMNNAVCGGNGNQGGKCAKKGSGITAHCELTFDVDTDCEDGQTPPPCDDEDCIVNQDGLCENGFCVPRDCFCFNTETYEPLGFELYTIFLEAGLLSGSYETEYDCLCEGCNGGQDCGEIKGDPHVSNWKGEWFEYMGECDIKFLYAPKFDGKNDMEIAVRTTIRDWYSFVEAAAMRIGDEIIEFDSYGNYVLNDVEGALDYDEDAPTDVPTIAGYPVHFVQENKKHTRLDVVLNQNQNVTFKSFKDWVSVHVTPGFAADFSRSVGFMGNYNGQMLARNGTDLREDINALAQDWQYKDYEKSLFRSLREPQWPQECNLPKVNFDGSSVL